MKNYEVVHNFTTQWIQTNTIIFGKFIGHNDWKNYFLLGV